MSITGLTAKIELPNWLFKSKRCEYHKLSWELSYLIWTAEYNRGMTLLDFWKMMKKNIKQGLIPPEQLLPATKRLIHQNSRYY
jgi:hypothetical protein